MPQTTERLNADVPDSISAAATAPTRKIGPVIPQCNVRLRPKLMKHADPSEVNMIVSRYGPSTGQTDASERVCVSSSLSDFEVPPLTFSSRVSFAADY